MTGREFNATPDPPRACAAWERITAAAPGADAAALPHLAHLLAISPASADKIVRDPESLPWLAEPAIHHAPRSMRQMHAALAALGWRRGDTPPREAHFTPLRRWKQREMLRIAYRDVAQLAPVEETMHDLSHVAEICIREITAVWLADHERRLGGPGTGFCVLGMGKLGGRELNYSSDIDLMFLFHEPGALASGLSRQEFFARAATRIIETFSVPDASGPLFRTDLRLRPEGAAGPLVRPLDGMENYYAAFGETWERMALAKARVVAGDAELGYEFFQRHQAFIYPRAVSPEIPGEIAAIKARIEREVVGAANLTRNVKLGRGGIREIEFVCQVLQILHGARHAFLQEQSTLRVLAGLRELGLLDPADAAALTAAYHFLRTVEHRLQIEHEAQTHTLPAESAALARLARSLGENDLPAVLARHMGAVRAIFDKTVSSPACGAVPSRDTAFFQDADAAARNLATTGGGGDSALIAPRTRRLFARLEPALLRCLRTVPDPDAALTRFARFTERYGLRGALFETLLVNPRVLELLVRLFDASDFLSEIAIRRPELIEEVARTGDLGAQLTAADHAAALARNAQGLPWPEWLRVYRGAQQLRIALRELAGFASLRDVFREMSALADACVVFAHGSLPECAPLTVVALGKFGGGEIAYGADLDVLFLGGNAEAARALMQAMGAVTAEGRVFPMDARLRPEGEAGALTLSLEAWCDYFERGRGGLWEAQALTKARPIAGPQQAAWLEAARRVWRSHGAHGNLEKEVAAMLERIAEHRGGDPLLDFKTGPGGLMHLEFFVQARQMRAGAWEPSTTAALDNIAAPATAVRLSAAWLALRQVETVLRRSTGAPASRLPASEAAQAQLAMRCGFASREAMLEKLRAARGTISNEALLGA